MLKNIEKAIALFVLVFIFTPLVKAGNVSVVNYLEKGTIYPTNENRIDTLPNDAILSNPEQEAEFPGGASAWANYISREITNNLKKFTRKDYGTCVVKFIVDKNGKVTDVEALTMPGSQLAKVSVDAIKNGPKWIPAQQLGVYVNAYRLQPVTLKNPRKK